jgi:hypothetical protein
LSYDFVGAEEDKAFSMGLEIDEPCAGIQGLAVNRAIDDG